MLFENNQVDSDDLPQIESLVFIPLEKKYLKVNLITNIIVWIIVLGGASVAYYFKSEEFPEVLKWIYPIFFVGVFLLSIVLIVLGFRKKCYALRQRDVIYRTGLIWQKETSLPFNRVQHCEVNQGPIERLFDLSNLHVFTAGGSSSDLSIPGLHPSKANKLKEYIVRKSAHDEEE